MDNSRGRAAFVAFQQPAWWGGKVVNHTLSAKEAIEEALLDFQVRKLPNIHRLPNGQEIVSESSFFTYRTDTSKVLGDKLGRIYTVLQNQEAFDIVDEILQSGTASIETAGALNHGATVFICMKINKDIIVNSNDVTKQYFVMVSTHDGSKPLLVFFTNVRVVCQNTLAAALMESKNEQVRIRHTTNIQDRLKEAARVMKLIVDNSRINEKNYSIMASTNIRKEQMWDYFGNLFFDTHDIARIQAGEKAKEVISKRTQNVINDVHNFAFHGIGQDMTIGPNGELTMWTAFNAVTGYATGKKYSSLDDRTESLLFGTSAQLIKQAGVLALKPEEIKPLFKSQPNLN